MVLGALAIPAAASFLAELDGKQLECLARGEQVVVAEEMPGLPWPRVRIYQRVEASPEEVAAVFFDYKNAKTYVPKVIKSDVSRTISPCTLEVDYGIDVPILPDEFYTAKNSVQAIGPDEFLFTWSLVRALQTKASQGSLRIERWKDAALLSYTNLVTPGSAMAGLLRSPAIDQMKNTVNAIVSQVTKQKKTNPAGLKEQVRNLQEALAAEGSPTR